MLNPNQTGGGGNACGRTGAGGLWSHSKVRCIMKLNDGNWRAFWVWFWTPHARTELGDRLRRHLCPVIIPSDTLCRWRCVLAAVTLHTSYYCEVKNDAKLLSILLAFLASCRMHIHLKFMWLKSISEFSNCECILWQQCVPPVELDRTRPSRYHVRPVDYQTLITNFP